MSEYVLASEDAYLKADATAVSVSLSIGGAIGVAVVNNRVHSDIAAWIANALVASTNTTMQADANTRIQKTTTAAVSAALVAGAGNESEAEIATQVSAYVDAATLVAMGDVAIRAMADNYARADGFGGYAVGAMVADIALGRGNNVDEVTAVLRGGADVGARSLTIEATSTDDLLSESIVASAAYIGVAGAQANVANDLATLAQIGDSSDVLVTSLAIRSTHEQDVDTSADSYALSYYAGSGAGADNDITTKANVDIGDSNTITADNIVITAQNILSKNKLAEGDPSITAKPNVTQVRDVSVTVIPNTTQVRDISTDKIYKYVGSNQDQVFLFATDFASDANWEDTSTTGDDNWADPDSNAYR